MNKRLKRLLYRARKQAMVLDEMGFAINDGDKAIIEGNYVTYCGTSRIVDAHKLAQALQATTYEVLGPNELKVLQNWSILDLDEPAMLPYVIAGANNDWNPLIIDITQNSYVSCPKLTETIIISACVYNPQSRLQVVTDNRELGWLPHVMMMQSEPSLRKFISSRPNSASPQVLVAIKNRTATEWELRNGPPKGVSFLTNQFYYRNLIPTQVAKYGQNEYLANNKFVFFGGHLDPFDMMYAKEIVGRKSIQDFV